MLGAVNFQNIKLVIRGVEKLNSAANLINTCSHSHKTMTITQLCHWVCTSMVGPAAPKIVEKLVKTYMRLDS